MRDRDTFFIGWQNRLSRALLPMYFCIGLLLVVGGPLAGLTLGRGLDDPGRNIFANVPGSPQAAPQPWEADRGFQGVLTQLPYPVLHVRDTKGGPITRSLLLSNPGKRGGVVPQTTDRVEAMGGLVRRGDIEMLIPDDEPMKIGAGDPAPVAQPLGWFRAVGEICDGKCYPGGMRPGGGLSHRACATLCLLREVPAIFVLASPIAGSSFLLLADRDGRHPPPSIMTMIAKPVVLEGEVERLGRLLILRIDETKASLL